MTPDPKKKTFYKGHSLFAGPVGWYTHIVISVQIGFVISSFCEGHFITQCVCMLQMSWTLHGHQSQSKCHFSFENEAGKDRSIFCWVGCTVVYLCVDSVSEMSFQDISSAQKKLWKTCCGNKVWLKDNTIHWTNCTFMSHHFVSVTLFIFILIMILTFKFS